MTARVPTQPPLLLVSGATQTLRTHTVGHLIVPRQWNDPATLDLQPGRWAMDNGAFSGFDPAAFMRMLEAYHPYQGCLFVTAPDVVGDAASTLRLWPFWSTVIRGLGWSPAFVLQEGITSERVPWEDAPTLFVGGREDCFKEGDIVRELLASAKAKGRWTHWGRVNSKRRYELALKSGCDSFDGSGFSKWPETNIPLVTGWHTEIQQQPELDL